MCLICAKLFVFWYYINIMKKRLLSGIQPSGTMHIGNYFGAIRQFVNLQDEYDSFIFIADFHAMTTTQNKETLLQNTFNVALDYLACGLDPKKIHLFKQSDIPEVTELTWYFNCITTMPFLERATAYKDALSKDDPNNPRNTSNKNNKEINVGLFDYPILMAADILIQDANVVPVGADQKQHVEYARDIAQKFNNIYGNTFILPEALIMKEVSIVPGIDGKKMSKSYKNTIPLFGSDEEIRKSVMKITTDSKGEKENKDPEICNIFKLHKLFLNNQEIENLKNKYINGEISYFESKEMLYQEIINFIKPMREKRDEYKNNPDIVYNILENGANNVREIIYKKMSDIRSKVGIKK